jgi:hypothetical protein
MEIGRCVFLAHDEAKDEEGARELRSEEEDAMGDEDSDELPVELFVPSSVTLLLLGRLNCV